MKKFIVVIVLFLGVVLVILSFSELQSIILTLQRASPWFLALAIAVQAAWYFVLGWTFQSIYGLLGLKESRRHLALVAAAGSFVNVVTPSAGVGALAIFITDGRSRSHPPGKVTVAGALYLLLDEAAFLCVLALGMIVLIRRNNLGLGEITAALILLAIACVLTFLLYLGYRSADRLGNVLAKTARVVNRTARPFIHREYLSETRAHSFASEIADGLGSLPEKPRSLIPPFLLSLANKTLLMVILIFAFMAFEVPFSAGTIVGGFAIAYLFLIVSPTPSGIGVVEGVMSVALGSLGVDFSQAVIITLTYRGITFWLPLAVGALAFRALNFQKKIPKVENEVH
ncbi:MAG: flippase-like domain-containing protein [Chloroflexi bacterium]|nr:flippase-like domain-containing protein [Chloroflexota bacterium]